jgi:hypothetical protein
MISLDGKKRIYGVDARGTRAVGRGGGRGRMFQLRSLKAPGITATGCTHGMLHTTRVLKKKAVR